MNEVRTLRDFMRVGLANYTCRAIGAFITIILARWMGPNGFGIYSIGFYVLTIFGQAFYGFDQSYVHFVVRDPNNEEEIFSTYFLLKIAVSLSIILICIALVLSPLSWHFFTAGNKIILWGLTGGLGMQLLMITLSYYQARKNFYLYNRAKLAYYAFYFFVL